jgi:mono/diheme cytochrome c family protein
LPGENAKLRRGQIAQKTKEVTIGGKDWMNPTPDDAESQRRAAEHFRHHCQFCHGLDGQNTGVPYADKMSPGVADLASTPRRSIAMGN